MKETAMMIIQELVISLHLVAIYDPEYAKQ